MEIFYNKFGNKAIELVKISPVINRQQIVNYAKMDVV